MFRRIVIGYDGRAGGADALALGGLLAQAEGASVIVASAYAYDPYPVAAYGERFEHHLRAGAEQHVEAALAELPEGVSGEGATLPAGSPAAALHELAAREDADLIVIGSSHRGRIGRLLAGDTGERLLHGAPCAVGLAPQGFRDHAPERIRSLGVAWDGSPESESAVSVAEALCRELGATLRVVSVALPPGLAGATLESGAVLTAESSAELAEQLRRRVQRTLDERVDALPDDIRVESEVRQGDPVHELAEAAAELDLLLTGSRGYGPLRSVLLGGVSAKLLRAAPCPVIVTPRGARAPGAAGSGGAAETAASG